jgi:hypothetical protein
MLLILLVAFVTLQAFDLGGEEGSQLDETEGATAEANDSAGTAEEEANDSEVTEQVEELVLEEPMRDSSVLPLLSQEEVEAEVAGELAVGLLIETTYPDNNEIAYNGERVTYTILISNAADAQLELLVDLPPDTFQNITCISANLSCSYYGTIDAEESFPNPLGGSVTVTETQALTWTIPSDALPEGSFRLKFGGKLIGQSNNTSFSNRVAYRLGNDVTGESLTVETDVRIRIRRPGQLNLSSAPTWFSEDLGGTLSQDWADFDLDGDLDLALGSSGGAAIYEFNGSRLERIWDNYEALEPNQRLTYGVRWGDFAGDAKLELVTVGASDDGTVNSPSINRIYQFAPNGPIDFTLLDTFTSDTQFVRVETGDLDNNGSLDLVVSTNSINAACPVRFYSNSASEEDPFDDTFTCMSTQASANLSLVDKNNDDQLDLVLGLFESQSVRLFVGPLITRNSTPLTESVGIALDDTILFLPYDFAWGDYDGDGDLDVAAGYPLDREVRVYPNTGGDTFGVPIEIATSLFRTPLALDWADFDGDGKLDLVVNDMPPRFYKYNGSNGFDEFEPLAINKEVFVSSNQLWSVEGADQDGDGDLDLAITNRDGASSVFTIFAPQLATQMTALSTNQNNASSYRLAWGDANGDGWLDLVFGATDNASSQTRLHINQTGNLSNDVLEFSTGFGPHNLAFGDMNGDQTLDLAIGSSSQNRVFPSSNPAAEPWLSDSYKTTAVAWADVDDDRKLDLLVANQNQPLQIYLNQGNILGSEIAWTSNEEEHALNIAWADYDNDYYLDFAVANKDQSARLYRNNGVRNVNGELQISFALVWSSPQADTRDVAWGDVDGDGDLDLAVAYYENAKSANAIYKNMSSEDGSDGTPTLESTPFWEANESRKTTSLAWGDFDNDGDIDLAVGNDGQPDQLYVNEGSTTEVALLEWLWQSTESYATTDLAWGDSDRDGDLDLAVSTDNNQPNGLYINNYTLPSHLSDDFISTMPLLNNPSYVAIARPGKSANGNFTSTDDAYLYSEADILSGQLRPIVQIPYKVYDPDGTRSAMGSNRAGNQIVNSFFEYSLNGGSSWQPATQAANTAAPLTQTLRLGNSGSFFWDAQADEAISDNARFRVRVVPTNNGLDQRASTTAISPPFRVRGLSCVWPRDANITINPSNPNPGDSVQFIGTVTEGTGSLTFKWDFGDGSGVKGQIVNHPYSINNIYHVKLTVEGDECPKTRAAYASQELTVGTGVPPNEIYLPLISTSPTTSTQSVDTLLIPLPAVDGRPIQVSSLQGETKANATTLTWHPTDNSEAEAIRGYRIYRAPLGTSAFELLAEVPADETEYSDQAECGYAYYVTAFNQTGESPASNTSYALLACE